MYLASKNSLPPSFKNLFLVNSEVHSYNTRSSNLISIQFSVYYQGPVFFKSLNQNLRNAMSVYSFQSNLKKH
jgi:hypothetical protein